MKQWPQETWKGMTTRSPTERFVAPLPTSSTIPIGSWPRMSPSGMNGVRTSYRWRSEPQIAVIVMRITASVGSRIVGSGTSSNRTSRLPCRASAFIPLFPVQLLRSHCYYPPRVYPARTAPNVAPRPSGLGPFLRLFTVRFRRGGPRSPDARSRMIRSLKVPQVLVAADQLQKVNRLLIELDKIAGNHITDAEQSPRFLGRQSLGSVGYAS